MPLPMTSANPEGDYTMDPFKKLADVMGGKAKPDPKKAEPGNMGGEQKVTEARKEALRKSYAEAAKKQAADAEKLKIKKK